jgi:ABC-type lipoprotein export system ATPase subunit
MNRTPSEPFAVRLDKVSKNYATGGVELCAVADVSLEVRPSERVAILGKSGCGKSTLLNLIGGLDRPSSGTVAVGGRWLSDLSSNQLADFRRDDVGIIFQSYNLVASRTALQNVELPAIFAGRSAVERRTAARDALAAVGLGQRIEHRPAELSGGEQQRVAIARAIINGPRLLLADEPTGNLDSNTAAEVIEVLEATISARGMTLIFVTHDDQLAARLADRVLRMVDGRILEDLQVAK